MKPEITKALHAISNAIVELLPTELDIAHITRDLYLNTSIHNKQRTILLADLYLFQTKLTIATIGKVGQTYGWQINSDWTTHYYSDPQFIPNVQPKIQQAIEIQSLRNSHNN